jgi:hypothetical protein
MENWHPTWWNEASMTAWERVKEAMHRDWVQTKHDLGAKDGHYLKQGVADTVKQMTGSVPIPQPDQPNPVNVVGNWDDIELPVGYGYAARERHGASAPQWSDTLEAELRMEWEGGPVLPEKSWNDVSPYVRHGYEYKPLPAPAARRLPMAASAAPCGEKSVRRAPVRHVESAACERLSSWLVWSASARWWSRLAAAGATTAPMRQQPAALVAGGSRRRPAGPVGRRAQQAALLPLALRAERWSTPAGSAATATRSSPAITPRSSTT